jgi:hypothetical protein
MSSTSTFTATATATSTFNDDDDTTSASTAAVATNGGDDDADRERSYRSTDMSTLMRGVAHVVDLERAYRSTDLREFLGLVFPVKWAPLTARILESGATFQAAAVDKFAPRWSHIPLTERVGRTDRESWLKSIMFRVHDSLHQLWGLPTPTTFDDAEFYAFKRMWMCAEVAVLTITEFFYSQWLYDTQPHLRDLLIARETLVFKNSSALKHLDVFQTAARLDTLLHKQAVPQWVRSNPFGMAFVDDYVPMLQQDRNNIDWNWALLKAQRDKSYLARLPNQRYGTHLDGLELTLWMMQDFTHQMNTGAEIDEELAAFNAKRRSHVALPDTWNECAVAVAGAGAST